MNSSPSDGIESELRDLRSRLLRIEEALRSRGVALEEPAPPPAAQLAEAPVPTLPPQPISGPVAEPRAIATPVRLSEPPPSPASPPAVSDDHSLESRIGSQWFNRIGILAVLIGMAWFLKFAIDNHWIGPLGRILIGLVAGAGLIAWSERFRSRGYAVFSYSLKAIGSGTLYLSLWAAFSLYQLLPAGVAFAAMILVTAFNGLMAWVQDAELLALYAIVGGLSTPLLLSTGENHEVALFSYLLILDVAVLVLVALKPWSRLLFAAFTGTTLIFLGWWSGDYSDAQFARTAFFLACFFVIFAFAPRLVRICGDDAAHPGGWDALAVLVLPVATASLGFWGFLTLLDRPETEWAQPWLAVAFAAFYLLLLRLPARGRLKESPKALESLHLAAAVVFLTIAIPLKAKGRWLTIGWLAEGAALLWVSARLQSLLLKFLALGCLALGLGALLLVNPDTTTMPLLNARFGTYCVAIGVFAFAGWVAGRARESSHAEHAEGVSWEAIAAASLLIVNFLILVAVGLEIHSFWWARHWGGLHSGRVQAYWEELQVHRMYAEFSYSAWFMLFGAILLAVGFARRSAFLRWQSLFLLAVSIGKVFLVDTSALSQGYRILSFLGLGVLLLGVSFVYQRDWLNLRGKQTGSAEGSKP